MESFFRYINLFPMPLWLAMMFAPNHPMTRRASRSTGVFAIAAINYLLSLFIGIRSGESSDQGLPDFTSLEGISRGLGTKGGALGVWSHLLALDLFTGAWIYRQCTRLRAPSWVRVLALFFTLMTGPFGLLLFLVWRLIAGVGSEEIVTRSD